MLKYISTLRLLDRRSSKKLAMTAIACFWKGGWLVNGNGI